MAKRTIEDIYSEIIEQNEIISNAELELKDLSEELKKKVQRKDRYWENKEEENLRSKIWRLQQKLNKMLEEKDSRNKEGE